MGSVKESLIRVVEEELLGFVINDLLLNKNVKWGWAIIDSGENELVLNIILSKDVEVHAVVWLHGGGNWLGEVSSSLWNLSALTNLDIKVNIRVKWDWLSTNTWPGVGISVSEVIWAVELGLVSLMELTKSQFEALESLRSSKRDNEVSSISLIGGALNLSTILEVSLVRKGNPITGSAFLTGSLVV
jgi:hypothetical protein